MSDSIFSDLLERIDRCATGDPESDHGDADDVLVEALKRCSAAYSNPVLAEIADRWQEYAANWWWA